MSGLQILYTEVDLQPQQDVAPIFLITEQDQVILASVTEANQGPAGPPGPQGDRGLTDITEATLNGGNF
jgi:hypothetical protein